jgi:plasmid stabilization system protein ParE
LKVEFSDEAQVQVQQIDAWWRQNRPSAPDLFTAELDEAVLRLERTPTLGTPYHGSVNAARRMLLRRTHYHVYFIERAESLYVLAVWNVYRGRGPNL